jgi:hypothetical protein
MNEGLVFLGTFFGGAAAVAAYAAHLPPNNCRDRAAARYACTLFPAQSRDGDEPDLPSHVSVSSNVSASGLGWPMSMPMKAG